MNLPNHVQLITYPDSLGGDIKTLHEIMNQHFSKAFGGVHILPPFPSSGDRGFAPLTYLEIEPSFGTWEDIRALGEEYDVLLDLMINHISQHSEYFKDYLIHGDDSPWADIFLPLTKIWADGEPVEKDLEKIFLRRPVPYSSFTIEKTKETVKVWTTFGDTDPSEQIDLDIYSPKTRELIVAFLKNFADNNVTLVRLDAVGFVVKKMGTSCFFVEPEINDFMRWIQKEAKALGITLLPEVHGTYEIQSKISAQGYWTYDFILPYLILESIIKGSNESLVNYLPQRPERLFTMLDCHDGIPVKPDLDGYIEEREAVKIAEICRERGARFSRIESEQHKGTEGFDIHQICGTYYSMLDENDDAYVLARTLQYFVPGIPQVYYVGILAGVNRPELVEKTGDRRSINRQNYTKGEVQREMQRPIVQKLLRLTEFRNHHPAFDGTFRFSAPTPQKLVLSWENENHLAQATLDFSNTTVLLTYTKDGAVKEEKIAGATA